MGLIIVEHALVLYVISVPSGLCVRSGSASASCQMDRLDVAHLV
jgi:hypothetical protein